ncbi:cubilin-like isoform X2 [Brevipalpus obovatus]
MVIDGPKTPANGTFSSPKLNKSDNHTQSCTYTFIASENRKVLITFDTFNLRGSPPDCTGEFLDIYNELEEADKDLIRTPLSGRYCARSSPKERVSLYQTLVLNFHTDKPSPEYDLFTGTYQFIDASPFIAGTPSPRELCSFTIFSDIKKEGFFQSPTYPGVYPKNIECKYLFKGGKGQRIKIEFLDFDLFYGGAHCPFDRIQVYDGEKTEDPLIGTYCGQKSNLAIYSVGPSMLIVFSSLQRTAPHENRGYQATFEFSERFVNLDLISKSDGEHIRGTECDQKIASKGESNGTIYSPNYPFLYHSNTMCKYYLYGMDDETHLERVVLEFEKLEIPVPKEHKKQSHSVSDGDDEEYECEDAALQIYSRLGKDPSETSEPDYQLCGTEKTPPSVISDGPTLSLVFLSGSTQGQGFKARYNFEIDYRIRGVHDEPGCRFRFNSENYRTGKFNSPRYPHRYFPSMICEYYLESGPDEYIDVMFEKFALDSSIDTSLVLAYNEACTQDWLEWYEINVDGVERLMGRYCAEFAPGPYLSSGLVKNLKFIMKSDQETQQNGFLANFEFSPLKSFPEDCGENITNSTTGIIGLPVMNEDKQPRRTFCNWYIQVQPRYKILLSFFEIGIEGQGKGCRTGAIRVWKDANSQPIEICKGNSLNGTREIISSSNWIKISYTATSDARTTGFQAVWTEIPSDDQSECIFFKCPHSGYCIPEELKCNQAQNCGILDHADEVDCIRVTQVNELMMISMIIVGTILFLIVFCSLCHQKHKRRRPSETIADHFEVHRPKLCHETPSTCVPPYLHVDSV